MLFKIMANVTDNMTMIFPQNYEESKNFIKDIKTVLHATFNSEQLSILTF